MRIGQGVKMPEPQVADWVRTVRGLRDSARELRRLAAELLPVVEQHRRTTQEWNQKRMALLSEAGRLENRAKAIENRARTAQKAAQRAPKSAATFRSRGMRGLGQHVGPQSLLHAEAVKVLLRGLGQEIVELPPGFVPRTTIAWPKSTKKEKIVMGAALTALTASILYAVLAS